MDPAGHPYFLEMYKLLHETQRYEGDGIWSRFNILTGLHVVLFGAITVVLTTQPTHSRAIFLILSFGGALLALWALYVLNRLWRWHDYWKQEIQKMEEHLPTGLPRIMLDRPAQLRHRPGTVGRYLLAYTQPFMLVLLLMWFALVVVGSTAPFKATVTPGTPTTSPSQSP